MSAKTTIHESMPQDGDGCSVDSWRCNKPSQKDMKNGRVNGDSPEKVKLECKRCPVCMMILCQYHMSESTHMKDCNYRSNQERQLLEEQRIKEAKVKADKKQDESRLLMVKHEVDEKEKRRRKFIAERNRKTIEGK